MGMWIVFVALDYLRRNGVEVSAMVASLHALPSITEQFELGSSKLASFSLGLSPASQESELSFYHVELKLFVKPKTFLTGLISAH
jgi:hypothetical protein